MAQKSEITKATPEQQRITQQIIEALRELNDDSTVPRNIKLRLEKTIKLLEEQTDVSIKVDKAQQELDDINDDSNLQSYTRTQIWNIVSLLEKL